MDSKKFYGVYRGLCVDVNDPEQLNRIRLKVPQVLGQEITNWAYPMNPVTNNSNHPDHLPHLASQVAALLASHATHATHTATLTTSSGGSPAHTHSVTISLSHDAHTNNHTGNSPDSQYQLTHAHVSTVDTTNLWNDSQETFLGSQAPEHTAHRLIPALNQGVWVMFEGGDPNFPLWVGVF